MIRIALEIEDQAADLRTLMRHCRDRPMSMADACLVRLSELYKHTVILRSMMISTSTIYCNHGNRVIPILMPE